MQVFVDFQALVSRMANMKSPTPIMINLMIMIYLSSSTYSCFICSLAQDCIGLGDQ